jgi:hypothetical protein
MNVRRIGTAVLVLMFASAPLLLAQEEGDDGGESAGPSFSAAIEIGAETFNESGGQVTYQKLSFKPDIGFGKVGLGFDLTFHYRFTDEAGGGSGFDFRWEDWVPTGNQNVFDVYLPIFRYIRYGHKGDPLYGKFGSIENGTLGTGFLMGSYANTHFLPERRIMGLALDVDGKLVNFPYVGVESFVGNLAQFDVIGSRLYLRPLAATELPIVKNLQLGSTVAADTNPDALYDFTVYTDPSPVNMFSFDFIQPLLTEMPLTLSLFGDLAFQPGGGSTNTGGLVGIGGELIGFIDYGLNALFIGENFVPFYFDATYDLFRESKYAIYSGNATVESYAGWLARLGFNFFDEAFTFETSLDGSFTPTASKESTLPHLRATMAVAEGVIPGIHFDATYDKKYIQTFDDLVDPRDAVIGANVHYTTGPAVITLGYTLRYVPTTDSWETTAKLSSSINL